MKFRHFAVILSALGLVACEDNGEVGSLIQPSEDVLSISSFMVNVQTESVLADSSLCKSANFILGQYTDPKFGVTQAEFVTQIDGRLGGVFIFAQSEHCIVAFCLRQVPRGQPCWRQPEPHAQDCFCPCVLIWLNHQSHV